MTRHRLAGNDPADSEYLGDHPGDPAQLYGAVRKHALTSLSEALRDKTTTIVDEFYREAAMLPDAWLLDALSPEGLEQLRTYRSQNLMTLVSADLTESAHQTAALHLGRLHAIMGVPRERLVRIQDILQATVQRHVDTVRHSEALTLLAHRLIRDLGWQMESYQRLQQSRHDVLLEITRLAWKAESYTDLIGRAAEILGNHDEIAGCSFGRPDAENRFRFEAASGSNIEAYLSALEWSATAPIMADDRLEGRGPTGRAWQNGTLERCINFATDDRMTTWRALAEQQGFRSSVAVPLCQPGRTPKAILTLYCAYPGGYTAPDQATFVVQIQTLLSFALTRIESLQGHTSTIPYSTRQRWASLLRSDALEMYFQPVLDLATGRATRVEALARLRDGDSMVPPGAFFPALSSEDFLVLYTRGLEQALAHRNRWLELGFDIGVSMNLPSSALGDIEYFDATRHMLEKYRCPASRLTLEVLETDEVPTGVDVLDALTRLKHLGVNLAEDDLGSGHSSLTRLRALPFDEVKIDRSIVALADGDRSNVLRFIYQLTRLGHSLGKSVVVEGVETEDLLEAIVVLGADAIQGYFVARPMPADQLLEWLKSGREPALPDRNSPRSSLAKLARLLVWEEHLYLLLRATHPRGSETTELPSDSLDHRHRESLESVLAFLPFGLVDPAIQREVVSAAVNHGLGSIEYSIARQHLISALTAQESQQALSDQA